MKILVTGGAGTRLWPLSRTGFPKQFLCLTGSESLFQQAARRLSNLGSEDIAVAPALIVTGEDHRFLASEQLREIGIDNARSLLEPVGRNTVPALTLAALAACENGNDPVLVVTAEITNGSKVLTLSENQSTYIPLGEMHRLANPGTIPLEIIEVQSGSYLGEDDIVRFEDTYGRAQ
jgi:mannose-1-phosphate guanylyltransferase